MDIKKAIVDTTIEVLPMYGLFAMYNGDSEEPHLISASDINVIMGLSGAIKGNMVFAVNRTSALKIVSAMMGGMKFTDIDEMVKSAIGELLNIIAGNALIKVKAGSAIHISPPTLVTGEKIYLLISRFKSNKLAFKIGRHFLDISFSVE